MKYKKCMLAFIAMIGLMNVGCSDVKQSENTDLKTEESENVYHPIDTIPKTDNKAAGIFYYESNGDGTCSIIDCVDEEEVTVPEYSPDGDKVVSLDFAERKDKVKTVIIPKTVTKIGELCFQYWTVLEKIELPDSIETIEKRAFYHCPKLKDVTFSTGLKSINEEAFEGCTALTEIHIPEGCENIYRNAFSGCTALKVVDLPQSLRQLHYYAFSGCVSLTTIGLKANLSIGNGVFYRCTSLTEVILDDGLEEIGESAFEKTGIRKIFIPKSVARINRFAFMGCFDDLTIYCEAESKPETWDDSWNHKGNDEAFKTVWKATRASVEWLKRVNEL